MAGDNEAWRYAHASWYSTLLASGARNGTGNVCPSLALTLKQVARRCLVRGIRNHLSFANNPLITELCAHPGQISFARARNARLIMSNVIPDMKLDAYPYCISYPQSFCETVAREEIGYENTKTN
ncbi:hypothetical protein GQ53DRAFT_761833 [Thozetella sp. PMI_491]|nr:hypothetical protein GQ53DRAFT_761833 [Thozetella sp. PMI_491]